ncbi:hypothetical protein G7Z17_g627 [Cylindrodendrum hubeiense]|uniref:Enoyl reductase (ER) domain-containing protein n=1 Tax=Cylindrodendrum hubeiense TaxID=595255 RepID=A0A9P5LMZ8_9HYPO|nr:hypothetical protein G7Z17_g627 [Cylindrodendrum hubeiense]
MSTQPYTFEGWLSHDKSSADGKMTWEIYEPKPWEETDVDIRITHCGVCGSDLHVMRSGWGETPYPLAVGHEIVGIAVRVGSAADGGIQVGDRVGVGAQSDSCQTCEDCTAAAPNFCDGFVPTYGGFFPGTGAKSMGGYAKYSRVPSRFIIKIPDSLDSAFAAPMLCGGVTVFSPLMHLGNPGGGLAGMKVGVVGIGGLGHFAVLFAKALDADQIVGISRRAEKREDSLKLGCDKYISTEEDENWRDENYKSLNLIISTVSSSEALMADYMTLLKRDGTMCQLGNPDDGDFKISAFMVMQRVKFTGSMVGSPTEIRQMLQFAADYKIKPWIQEWPMTEANEAILDLQAGKPRYRYVLVN